MNDQDPPMWIPLKRLDLTDKQKEEIKKNTALSAELKMNKGFLICKSVFDSLEESVVDQKTLDSYRTNPDQIIIDRNEAAEIKVVKCPMTGDLLEKTKIRKVFIC